MSALLLTTLLLTLASLLTSSLTLTRILLPLLPPSLRSLSPPSLDLHQPPRRLTPFQGVCIALTLADLLGLGVWMWQSVLQETLYSGYSAWELGGDQGDVGRYWLVLIARPTVLLFGCLFLVTLPKEERPLGRKAVMFWLGALLVVGGSTLAVCLAAPRLTSSSFSTTLLAVTASLALLSTLIFLAHLFSASASSTSSPTSEKEEPTPWPAPHSPTLLRHGARSPSEDYAAHLRQLRHSESWLTSEAGSIASHTSVGSWSFSSSEEEERYQEAPEEQEQEKSNSTEVYHTCRSHPSTAPPQSRVPSAGLPAPVQREPEQRPHPRFTPLTLMSRDSLTVVGRSTPTLVNAKALAMYSQSRVQLGTGEEGYAHQEGSESGRTGEKALKCLAWMVYVFLPFALTTPYLINELTTTPHVSFSNQILLSVSITISSPILCCILLFSAFTTGRLPVTSDVEGGYPEKVVLDRPDTPALHTPVWRQPGKAASKYQASIYTQEMPAPATDPAETAVDVLPPAVESTPPVETDILARSAALTPSMPRPPEPAQTASSLKRSTATDQTALTDLTDRTITDPRASHQEESFQAEIVRFDRVSASAATVLAISPPTPTVRSRAAETLSAEDIAESGFIRDTHGLDETGYLNGTQGQNNTTGYTIDPSEGEVPMRIVYSPVEDDSPVKRQVNATSFLNATIRTGHQDEPTEDETDSIEASRCRMPEGNRASSEVEQAESSRQVKHSSLSTLSSVTEASNEDNPPALQASTPAAPMRQYTTSTPSIRPTPVGESNPTETLTATPHANFVVQTGQTPLMEARPAATQFTPGGPRVRAFHLPRRKPQSQNTAVAGASATPSRIPRSPAAGSRIPRVPGAPRRPSRPEPAHLVPDKASPQEMSEVEIPQYPLRLLSLRQTLYQSRIPSAYRPPLADVSRDAQSTPLKPDDKLASSTPDGPSFNSAEYKSTPISPKEKAKQRILRVVDSAASMVSNRSKSTTLESIGPLRI